MSPFGEMLEDDYSEESDPDSVCRDSSWYEPGASFTDRNEHEK